MMEDLATVAPEAPAADVVAPETKAPETKTEAKKPEAPKAEDVLAEKKNDKQKFEDAHDAELRKAFRKANKPRADDGKFAAIDGEGKEPAKPVKDAAPQEADSDQQPKEATQKDEATEKPAKSLTAAPKSWSADMKAKFDTLSPDVRDYIAKRDSESENAIRRLGQFASDAKPLVSSLERHQHLFQRAGLDYATGVDRLLQAQEALDRNPVEGLLSIAKTYGVDLAQLVNGQRSNSGEDYGLPPDPEVQALKDRIQQQEEHIARMTHYLSSQEQAAAQRTHNGYLSMIDKFAATAPDFDAVAPEIMANIQALRMSNPQVDDAGLLKEAYDRAIWSNPKTREAMQKRQASERIEAERKAAEEAANRARQAGAINVQSHRGVSPSDASEEDVLRATMRKIRSR